MADNGLRNMDETSEQATQQVKQTVSDPAKKAAKKLANKAGKKVGNVIGKGARKVGRAAGKAVKSMAKAAFNAGAHAAKLVASLLLKLLLLLSPYLLIILVVILMFVIIWVAVFEERGATETNDLSQEIQNPSIVNPETALTTAVAMNEPQAVIDAYYKYMSTQSFTKEYNSKLYDFADPDETVDFSALRDYYDKENNFYLSDDFIRMVDETLHQNKFYFPEQIIKPVYGERLNLVNKNGESVSAYTALLPMDFATGEKSQMFEDNFDDEKDVVVKGFDEMLEDRSQLDHSDITTANDEVPSLIAKSQTPVAHESTDPGEEGTTYYSLSERNVIDGSGAEGTQLGLWDYGFGSVLQYEPHQKIQFITCSYTSVDVDIHVRSRHWIEATEDEAAHWSDWSDWRHSTVYAQSLDGITTRAQLDAAISAHITAIDASTDKVQYDYSYNLPTGISSILSDTTNWNTANEPNAANEAALNRAFNNSHIDMKVEGAKDIDISRLEFSDELEAFANHGSALYPLNIALISHAATFSGNINYTITPAGEEGCNESRVALQPNTNPSSDHREPVKTIKVAGGCGEVTLTATREGEVVTQTPKVEEIDAPWGFEYMEEYAEEYTTYVPSNYMNDRDFFLRSGLQAVESKLNGTSNEAENKEAQQYTDNLEFLIELGLLRPYSGGNLSAMGTVDISDMEQNTEGNYSDLYILANLIAAEAAHDKLDQLLVGAVFVNRVHSDNFPNTYWDVLTYPNAYSTWDPDPSKCKWGSEAFKPSDEVIASAIQVMTGQFALPSNVVTQSQSMIGQLFMQNGVHYYCTGYDGIAPNNHDFWGRPAKSPEDLKALAKQLEGVDPNEISGEGINFNPSQSIFIGDSLTVGLDNTKGLSEAGASVIAEEGAGLDRIRELIEESPDSAWSGKSTVYLLAGTNSSTMFASDFTSKYNAIIDAINEKAPTGISIVLTSLPPVVDGAGHTTNNNHINESNACIQQIATSKGLPILDLWSQLQEDGKLADEYNSGDGLHLSLSGYTVWYSLIRGGAASGSIGNPGNIDFGSEGAGVYDVASDYRLYEIEGFDVLSAINMQSHLGTEDETARTWLESLGAWFVDRGEDFVDFISEFFTAMGDLIFPTPNTTLDKCFLAAAPYNIGDIQGIVYSTITFTSQVSYSSAEDAADTQMENGDISFLFVGKDAILGLGTGGLGAISQMVPGVGTTINGLISPTDTYYSPLTSFNGTYIEIAVPEGTNILAVGKGEITETDTVGDSTSAKGKYVVQKILLPDGRTMEVTYGFLDTVSVSPGSKVSTGDLIGISGKNQSGTASLYLRVVIDGENVDPLSIFYQPTLVYGAGSLGKNLNNADGTVNKDALQQLHEELNALVGLEPGNGYSPSSFNPVGKMPYLTKPMNALEPLQCTWWARARGLQYVMTFYPGKITYQQFNNSNRGNGGDVYANAKAAGIFGTGTMPKPNSLVSFSSSSGYGHVAYVEAVDYVNKVYYISEAGSGNYWGSLRLEACRFGDPGETALGSYRLKGFVYLDEILI